jgi:serine/threonine-protein kinase RsbW
MATPAAYKDMRVGSPGAGKRSATRLDRSYAAIPESVPLARDAAVRFAAAVGASEEVLQDVRLAVSEALTNVVVHAYPDDHAGPAEFELTAARASDELWILVADEGCGLSVREDSPGLGLGLALMLQLTREMELADRPLGGTQVTLRFPLDYSRLRRRRRLLATA